MSFSLTTITVTCEMLAGDVEALYRAERIMRRRGQLAIADALQAVWREKGDHLERMLDQQNAALAARASDRRAA